MLSLIFTPQALENIQKTGNVWGQTTEYDFNFTVRVWRRDFRFQQKSSKSFMGRHGGGWDVKFGFQASSWKSLFMLRDVIISFAAASIRISVKK